MYTQITEIFNINCEKEFQNIALKVFRFQYENNTVYQNWVKSFFLSPADVVSVNQIPFLPIEFFKSHEVKAYEGNIEGQIFTSSTTTSQTPSQHFVKDLAVYEQSFGLAFKAFFGEPETYCILALLPGYLDRSGSSLVYMCNHLIKQSNHPQSGFYLRDLDGLVTIINDLKNKKQKTLLIGVSYALLDLAAKNITLNEYFTVMETGGMKGTRKEMLKEELHAVLKDKFNIPQVASEYGMTELLSQAYAIENGKFKSPNWLRFSIRDINDPLTQMPANKTGGINVMDLANVYSCSFIATKDLGQIDEAGNLKLMGRYDQSDIRGCNLMVS